MDNFVFYSPTMFAFGDGEEAKTGELVKRFGGSKVLLVYGGGSVKRNGAYDAVTASLTGAGIPFVELSGIQANPRSGKVYEGIDIVRKEGVDFLLALGYTRDITVDMFCEDLANYAAGRPLAHLVDRKRGY